jgi:tetratricopeptide (TPR) repeat protein
VASSKRQKPTGQLLQREPDNVAALVGLGTACLQLGDPAKATASCQRALAACPGNIPAIVLAADIDEKEGRPEQAYARLRPLIAMGVSRPEVVLGYATARPAYDVQFIIDLYTPDYIKRMPRASDNSSRPVFVVGMHRSGTTLVEQILDCHPEIHGAGELPDIMRMLQSLGEKTSDSCRYLECLQLLNRGILVKLSARHLARLTALGDGAQRVVDKMPGNFMYLGFVKQFLPGARIIHCVRNPMDTCLSGYFQSFIGAHSYMNDLEDLGFVYRCYHRMMAHWNRLRVLPSLEMRYEDLVTRPEQVIREMVAFCGVASDARCLEFHRNGRYVNTASYIQVRQPMYRRSIGRWTHYARHLQPLRQALGDLAV